MNLLTMRSIINGLYEKDFVSDTLIKFNKSYQRRARRFVYFASLGDLITSFKVLSRDSKELAILKLLCEDLGCSQLDIHMISHRLSHAVFHIYDDNLVDQLISNPSRGLAIVLKYPHFDVCGGCGRFDCHSNDCPLVCAKCSGNHAATGCLVKNFKYFGCYRNRRFCNSSGHRSDDPNCWTILNTLKSNPRLIYPLSQPSNN